MERTMNRLDHLVICFLVALGMLVSGSDCFAADFIASRLSEGSYAITASNLQGAGGIQLVIRYNPQSLSNPRVSWASIAQGGLTAVNTRNPGEIRLVVISASGISGSGTLANIRFDAKGNASDKTL